MNKQNKRIFMLGFLFIFGLTLIAIGMKMTPQWLEFQNVSRINYLLSAFICVTAGIICLLLPLKFMIIGTREVEA